ncbi:MAG: hypothetical protein D6702_06805 [Planctomycetota bacterium]|nr:MAG: hypothetical protein D6702_06805 [Planctomycetota bacterium]
MIRRTNAALLAGVAAALAGCAVPAAHPWEVRSFTLQPEDGHAAGGLAIEHAYAEDRSVSVSYEQFTRDREVGSSGWWTPKSLPYDYSVLRVEHRKWFQPGERMEPYLGCGLGRAEASGSQEETEWTVFATAGFAWWWTPAISFDLGLLYDAPVSSDDLGLAPDWLQLRFGLGFWF